MSEGAFKAPEEFAAGYVLGVLSVLVIAPSLVWVSLRAFPNVRARVRNSAERTIDELVFEVLAGLPEVLRFSVNAIAIPAAQVAMAKPIGAIVHDNLSKPAVHKVFELAKLPNP